MPLPKPPTKLGSLLKAPAAGAAHARQALPEAAAAPQSEPVEVLERAERVEAAPARKTAPPAQARPKSRAGVAPAALPAGSRAPHAGNRMPDQP